MPTIEEILVESGLIVNSAMKKTIIDTFEDWLKQFVVTDPILEKHQLQNLVLDSLVQRLYREKEKVKK
jgi:hypothetical protein